MTRRKMKQRFKSSSYLHLVSDEAVKRYRTDKQLHHSKRFLVLRSMCEGKYDPWDKTTYGGSGQAWINVLGGFGYDRTIKHMVERGEIVISRKPMRRNAHGGNPTINYTYATITAKGRLAWDAMKKRRKV